MTDVSLKQVAEPITYFWFLTWSWMVTEWPQKSSESGILFKKGQLSTALGEIRPLLYLAEIIIDIE